MKNVVTCAAVCAVVLLSSVSQAAEPSSNALSAMGFGGMKKVSNEAGMQVRGKGYSNGGYTLTPYVISNSTQVISQHKAVSALSLNISLAKLHSVESTFAAKSEFVFIGPSLPHSYGNYGGGYHGGSNGVK